jgi:hypothetical protein
MAVDLCSSAAIDPALYELSWLMTRLLVGMNLCDGSPLGQRQSPFFARLQIGDAKQQTHPIGSARSAPTIGPVRFWCRTDRCAQQNSTERCAHLSSNTAAPSEPLASDRLPC